MSGYKVYDKVWLMINNTPQRWLIYSVTESMALMKTSTNTTYAVVNGLLGAGVGGNKEISVGSELLFDTKEELLGSL